MAIHLDWYVPNRVIHLQLYDVVSIEEFQEVNAVLPAYLNDSRTPAYVLSDETHLTRLVPNLLSIQESFGWLCHPHLKMVLACGEHRSVQRIAFITHFLQQCYRFDYQRLPGLQDALEYLRDDDPSLLL
ncbi:MAG: hypothetical protein HC915_18585 [Anaerolineae bacterium]|nr:hypothetical protein [Anaerolineae bacterium]